MTDHEPETVESLRLKNQLLQDMLEKKATEHADKVREELEAYISELERELEEAHSANAEAHRREVERISNDYIPVSCSPCKCPICDGTGLVSKPPWIAGDQQTWISTSTGTWPCKACGGTGIV